MKAFIVALELAWMLAPLVYKERVRLIMQDAKQQVHDEDGYA
jgi:hypothetical protein